MKLCPDSLCSNSHPGDSLSPPTKVGEERGSVMFIGCGGRMRDLELDKPRTLCTAAQNLQQWETSLSI